jgi:hypothetical protein
MLKVVTQERYGTFPITILFALVLGEVWAQNSISQIHIQSEMSSRNYALDNRITNQLEFLCICADQGSWASEKAY